MSDPSVFRHGVQVVPQPLPKRNPGGDCFACATTAALRFFYGDRAPTFDQVWECFLREQTDSAGQTSKHLCNTWWGYRSAFYAAAEYVGRMDIMVDLVVPIPDPEKWSHDWGVQVDAHVWARRLDAWLRNGYLAFASIRMDASPTGQWYRDADGQHYRAHTDHLVVLDGVRSGWRKHATVEGARSLVYQVHVVCSARGGRSYWIDVDRLLREHGAGAWWLIRPNDERGEIPVDEVETTWAP